MNRWSQTLENTEYTEHCNQTYSTTGQTEQYYGHVKRLTLALDKETDQFQSVTYVIISDNEWSCTVVY